MYGIINGEDYFEVFDTHVEAKLNSKGKPIKKIVRYDNYVEMFDADNIVEDFLEIVADDGICGLVEDNITVDNMKALTEMLNETFNKWIEEYGIYNNIFKVVDK